MNTKFRNCLSTLNFQKILLLLFLSLFLAPPFHLYAQENQDKPIEGKTVVMFDNSITNQRNWNKVLECEDVINYGITGYLTSQLIWTIKNVLKKYPDTKIWFLEGGINDISLGIQVNKIFENYKTTIDLLHRKKIIPVAQSTILQNRSKQANKRFNKLNKKVKEYIKYLDLNLFLSVYG